MEAKCVELNRLELPFEFQPSYFTLGELQSICESLQGHNLYKASFLRLLEDIVLVEPIDGEMRIGAFRPSQLYQFSNITKQVKE